MNSNLTASEQLIKNSNSKVAIIGGGVAGSTMALRFAELGIDTTLIEKGDSLVNGPPFCHLHAGGNLYREISDQQCLLLLQQAIDTVKVFPHSINFRPTVIALPKTDHGEVTDLLPRLIKLRARYAELVELDVTNKVLGDVEHYFQLYERNTLEQLAKQPLPVEISSQDDWLVAFAQQVNLETLKFPVLLVQEYGWSAFRLAAIATLASEKLTHCRLHLNHKVIDIKQPYSNGKWRVRYKDSANREIVSEFDYVVNACGFKSGEIDDMLQAKRQRMVEFKAAYVANWSQCQGLWPEVVVYGERGTPNGMAQLTPYPDGYFQLHGMTPDITLFEQGLVTSGTASAQPALPSRFIKKIEQQWPLELAKDRTLGSIGHLAQYFPHFAQAKVAAKPLFGAQQIPGDDASLRAADVSFYGRHYARAEIVKASSALSAADVILENLIDVGIVNTAQVGDYLHQHYFPVTLQCNATEVTRRAMQFARQRGYPEALAKIVTFDK
ncbi:FAD dependent oxidoreductase [Colwellia chukchiensis]|uniref:FAD dependent oxidoreductase n=1 Tax=Colwellia chukchiensis TaxID=641665 RepID=A0A1H7S779_9GAMM|nr:FAD-dependent oxidoreductase [Colwellia chukchiensis]SEL68395.1 FAD dependent oxidoreductase [Colwellia chukchiensis]